MDEWMTIRRRVLVEGVPKCQIVRETGMHWTTLEKILANSEPPGYQRRREPEKPKIGPYLEWIGEVLKADQGLPRKQRHNATASGSGRQSMIGKTNGSRAPDILASGAALRRAARRALQCHRAGKTGHDWAGENRPSEERSPSLGTLFSPRGSGQEGAAGWRTSSRWTRFSRYLRCTRRGGRTVG
jgi:hypothetical protein